MNRQSVRRKVRKRKNTGQNSRMKFYGFLGIMLLAVFLGYLTARFVVGPLIGFEVGESPARSVEELREDASEESSGTVPTGGYALQFGAFSTEQAAEDLAESLKSQGIETEVTKVDDVYKVIGPLVDTKEKALEALSNLPETGVADVFVAVFP